ncbi:MAG: ClbS/DfsB family four-helix bundle protein [Christensenellaceae bacterium]|jgi:hypothetical protein|nr:ClbS/DfsB family four-helix bundle protein [Christensenellaceae bacterium]
MAKATNKAELIKSANDNFNKMWSMINSMSPEKQNAVFKFGAEQGKEQHWGRDKNIRDILIHLYEWHNLLLEWEKANSNGIEKPFLPLPYNWTTYGKMNVEFWKKHQNTPLDKAKEMLQQSHKQVMAVVDKYNDKEIFTKKHFKWTGTSCLQQYFIGVLARHYEWAIKKLKLA